MTEVFGLDGADFFFKAGFGDRGFFNVDVGMTISEVVEQAEAVFLEGFGELGLEGLEDCEMGETAEIVGIFDTHQPSGEGVAQIGEAEGTSLQRRGYANAVEKFDEGLVDASVPMEMVDQGSEISGVKDVGLEVFGGGEDAVENPVEAESVEADGEAVAGLGEAGLEPGFGGGEVGDVLFEVGFDFGGVEMSGDGFADQGGEGFAVAFSGAVKFEDGGVANAFFGVPWHVDEQGFGLESVAVGFEGEEHFEVAAPEGNNGGEECFLGVPIDQTIHEAAVVVVFVEPHDNATLSEFASYFFFQVGSD